MTDDQTKAERRRYRVVIALMVLAAVAGLFGPNQGIYDDLEARLRGVGGAA